MPRFKVVVIKHGPHAVPNLDKDDRRGNTSCCFVCSKEITELQPATTNRLNNNKKLIQIFSELLIGEKLCSTDREVIMDLRGNNSSVSFHCCSTCRISLTFWHDLTNSIKTLTDRTSRIKSTIIAKILTSSPKLSCRQPSTTTQTGASSLLLQKLVKIKKEIIHEYSPQVVLEDLERQQLHLSIASAPTAVVVELDAENEVEEAVADPGFDLDLDDEIADNVDERIEMIDLLDCDFEANAEVKFDQDEDYDNEAADLDVDMNEDEIADTGDNCNATIDLLDPNPEATAELINSADSFDARSEVAVKTEDVAETVPPESTNLKGRKKRKQEFLKPTTLDAEIEFVDPTRQTDTVVAVNNDSEELQYYGKYPLIFNPSENDYSCGSCEARFEKRFGVLTHIRMCHFTDQDKQELTAVKLTDWEYLYREKFKIFRRNQFFHCGLCENGHRTLYRAIAHIRAKHVGKEVEEEDEQLALISSNTLKTEKINENKDETYRGIAYSFDPFQLKYKCSLCPLSSMGRCSIRSHIKNVHIGDSKKFSCEVCGLVLKTKSSRERHKLRIHGGAPTFICHYCGKVFKNKYYFDGHVAVHEKGEEAKKIQCEYCGKRFRDGAEYRWHVRRIHTKDVVYKCSLCDMRFMESWDLRRHRKAVHNIFYRSAKTKTKS